MDSCVAVVQQRASQACVRTSALMYINPRRIKRDAQDLLAHKQNWTSPLQVLLDKFHSLFCTAPVQGHASSSMPCTGPTALGTSLSTDMPISLQIFSQSVAKPAAGLLMQDRASREGPVDSP